MHIDIKIFILVAIFIIFIIAILVCKNPQNAYLAISFVVSMVILLTSVDNIISQDNKTTKFVNMSNVKSKLVGAKNNFSSSINNLFNKQKFQNQLNDGWDTVKTTDFQDEDSSFVGYDLQTRNYIDPSVIDEDTEMLDINSDGLVDQEELTYGYVSRYEDDIDYTGFNDLREGIDQINTAARIDKSKQKEIDDFMKLTQEEKNNYYQYKNNKQYKIDQKTTADKLKKPNCHEIQPNEVEVQAFKIYDYIRDKGRLVDDRAADYEYRTGRRDIRAKTGAIQAGRRMQMLTSQNSDLDQRREWWNDNAVLDTVLLSMAKKKYE